MITDLSKEIKAILYDRAKSPLFGAFLLSWAAWNFVPLASFFSSLEFDQKQFFWRAFYSDNEPIFFLLIYPLLSAIIFLLIYPFPARWVFRYTQQHNAKLKAIQQQIEDTTPLTQEEANALRKASLETQLTLQKQIRDLVSQIDEYRKANDDLTKALAVSHQKLDEQILRSRQLLDPDQPRNDKEIQSIPPKIVPREKIRVSKPEIELTLSEDQLQRLTKQLGDETTVAMFYALVKIGGKSNVGDLASQTGINPIEIRHSAKKLEQLHLLRMNADYIYLDNKGETLAVTEKLTR